MKKIRKESFVLSFEDSTALAGMARWIEHRLANQRVTGLIPVQGTRLGCGPGPQLGACERQLIDASPPFSHPPPLSKNE